MVFIINSDPDTADLYPALLHIYSNIYGANPTLTLP